ncbi:glucose/ribitol short chain dehydrogenase/reductase family protein [Candidatus Moduliflexus flocculans]|uniref:Glucose/ribitol short chain dehydrogenase/reductase family protein n=1 Tax=Candidatus Moduliflexus flocculans TaxID=1499966 RepID=A0A081BMZ2_9BACT|nr:glucose/ribitol short chain dehydrogenase/reductase family protein [Candidatus Moduliflexus flocculans]
MRTYIITGATSGLGLATARCLAQEPDTKVILAVRDTIRGRRIAAELGQHVEVVELDLSSLDNIDAFLSSWQGNITGLINNAGVQIINETRFTKKERFEETFAVNHLAALKLTMGLLAFLGGGRVLFIGSGTHNPNNRTAIIFGFRGAKFTSIRNCADGLNNTGSIRQLGIDRYATSKFLNMVTTVELARRIPPERVSFFCLDPGIMAGTGLARTAPAPLRFVWAHFLPFAMKFLPDASTPTRSGKAAARIVTSKALEKQTGTIFSFDCQPSTRVWKSVFDAEIGRRVVDDSLNLLTGKQHH